MSQETQTQHSTTQASGNASTDSPASLGTPAPKTDTSVSPANPSSTSPASDQKPTKLGPDGKPLDPTQYSLINDFTPQQIRVLFGCLMFAVLMASLDNTIVVVSLPVIAGDLGEVSLLSWVVSAYLLTSSATVPLYGKFSDIFGRRFMFLIAMTVFLLGSALSGAAQNMWWLIASRAFQGCGGGGLMSLTMIVVGDIVTPRERGRYIGYLQSSFTVSSIGGPLLGGVLTDKLSWRWCFFINIPICVIAIGVVTKFMRIKTPKVLRKIDYLGSLVSVIATTCIILAITWGGVTYPWNGATIVTLLVAAAFCYGLFVFVETKAKEPLMPLHLFKIHNFLVSTMAVWFVGVAMFTISTYLPLFFQIVLNRTATEAGYYTLPLSGSLIVTAVILGQVTTRTGRYRWFPLCGSCALMVGVGLLSTIKADTPYGHIAGYQVLIGIGFGCSMGSLNIAMQNSVTLRDMAAATSTFAFFRSVGGALGVAIYGAVLTNMEHRNIPANLLPLLNLDPTSLREVLTDPTTLHTYLVGYADSVGQVYLYLLPCVGMYVLLAANLKHVELRNLKAGAGAGKPGAAGTTAAGTTAAPAQTNGGPEVELAPIKVSGEEGATNTNKTNGDKQVLVTSTSSSSEIHAEPEPHPTTTDSTDHTDHSDQQPKRTETETEISADARTNNSSEAVLVSIPSHVVYQHQAPPPAAAVSVEMTAAESEEARQILRTESAYHAHGNEEAEAAIPAGGGELNVVDMWTGQLTGQYTREQLTSGVEELPTAEETVGNAVATHSHGVGSSNASASGDSNVEV